MSPPQRSRPCLHSLHGQPPQPSATSFLHSAQGWPPAAHAEEGPSQGPQAPHNLVSHLSCPHPALLTAPSPACPHSTWPSNRPCAHCVLPSVPGPLPRSVRAHRGLSKQGINGSHHHCLQRSRPWPQRPHTQCTFTEALLSAGQAPYTWSPFSCSRQPGGMRQRKISKIQAKSGSEMFHGEKQRQDVGVKSWRCLGSK